MSHYKIQSAKRALVYRHCQWSYRGLTRDNDALVLEHEHDKLVKLDHIPLVLWVLLWQLAIDICQEPVNLVVLFQPIWHLDVLGWNDGSLSCRFVDLLLKKRVKLGAAESKVSSHHIRHVVTDHLKETEVLLFDSIDATRKSHDTLVLRTECDQIVDWWIVTPFYVGS